MGERETESFDIWRMPLPMQIIYRALQHFVARAQRGADVFIECNVEELLFCVRTRDALLYLRFDCDDCLGIPPVVCEGRLSYKREWGSFAYGKGEILIKRTVISMEQKKARGLIEDLRTMFYNAIDSWTVDYDYFVRKLSQYFGAETEQTEQTREVR